MSSQLLDVQMVKNSKLPPKKRNKKRKKKNNPVKLAVSKRSKKKQCKVQTTMSEWAENFTSAATWQLKHQVAYWKARATSLEYENKLLHDIVRKYQAVEVQSSDNDESDNNVEEADMDEEVIEEEEESEEDEDFEVSEEFIQFLMANAKYKEDARQEREKLKAMREGNGCNAIVEMDEAPQDSADDRQKSWQELYGIHWQRISTLEMTLQSQFISECDKTQPVFWPHLPFNMKFN